MSRFTNRVLRGLDALYNFPAGTKITDQLDVGGQIQLVHNVSRSAELNAVTLAPATAGFFTFGGSNAHAGAGTLAAATDPYVVLNGIAGGPPVDQKWIWLYWLSASCNSAANLVRAGLLMRTAGTLVGPPISAQDFLIGGSLTGVVDIDGVLQDLHLVNLTGVAGAFSPFALQRLPLLIPAGSSLTWETEAAIGAVTIRFHAIAWAGPQGVYPPGLG